MIIKKKYRCKETGEMKTRYESGRKGWKVVMVKGKPELRKMDKIEKQDRAWGNKTDGHGAVESANKQRGKTKINAHAYRVKREEREKQEKEKMKDARKINEAKAKTLDQSAKKVDSLKQKLRKAKLDHVEMMLVQREAELVKKEKKLKNVSDFVDKDRKKLKDKHSYYTTDADPAKTEKLKADIVKRLDHTIGDINEDKKEEVRIQERKLMDKLGLIKDIDHIMYGDNKKCYDKGTSDIVTKLSNKIANEEERNNVVSDDGFVDEEEVLEADDEEPKKKEKKSDKGEEEEDPFVGGGSSEEESGGEEGGEEEPDEDLSLDEPEGEGTPEDTPEDEEGEESPEGEEGEEGDDAPEDSDLDVEDGAGEEGEEIGVSNEIQTVVDTNEYNVDINNAYDYYDFIVDKLVSANAIKALNGEYNLIPDDKRRITPASDLYKRMVKRLDLLNKSEQERLENELDVDAEGEGGEGEELDL